MIDQFEKCRENMVQSQLVTSGIVDPQLIESYETVPRERFCTGRESFCYNDKTLELPDGRFVLEPLLHARMIQALKLDGSEIVLDVGGATGYSAAILSSLVSTVVVLDADQMLLDEAVKVYDDLGFCNVIQHKGSNVDGCQHYGPYNAILVNGALNYVPEKLVDQLAVGGRLVYVHQAPGDRLGDVTLITKTAEDAVSEVVCTGNAPVLGNVELKKTFEF